MNYFFETTCHKCGTIDEAKFIFAGPHIKQICKGCGFYIKFFDKSKIPDVKEIKLKIFSLCNDIQKINEKKKEIGFIENLTGLNQKIQYWRLYLSFL